MTRIASLCFSAAAALIAAASPAAAASEIYRCDSNGTRTLVDAPHRCPNGQAVRIGGTQEAPSPATPPEASTSVDPPRAKRLEKRARPAERLPRPEPADRDLPIPAAPPPQARSDNAEAAPATPAAVASKCLPLRADAPALRRCLQEERRKEVHAIANARLAQLSGAVSEFANAALASGGVLAVSRTGRPAAWCESFLTDVMAQRNLQVVDDEMVSGPRWINQGGGGLRAAEVLDPDFTELHPSGGVVVRGYVTLRWKGGPPTVLRAQFACTEVKPGQARCNPQRYISMHVHDDEMPQACHVTLYGRQYWPQWRDSSVEIKLRPPR